MLFDINALAQFLMLIPIAWHLWSFLP